MPLNKFIPLSPDPNITRDSDMGMAQFGHLNTIVDYLNTYVAADSLQLDGTGPLSTTLRAITDAAGNLSPLKISTTAVQVVSPLRITTDDPSDMYLDCEDGSTNNRFNITRNTASQQVNLNFASNPAGSTTIVGAVRTYVDGVNLSEVMTFREDGFVGLGTTAPIAPLNVYNSSASNSSIVLVEQDTAAVIGQINQYRKNGSVNLVSGAEIGRLSFGGYFNSTYSPPSQVCSAIYGYYGGTGTDRVGGLRLITWNGGGASTRLQVAPDGKIGIGTISATAKLQIVGEGQTAATTSLLVQNSIATSTLIVYDDKVVEVPYRIHTPFIRNENANLVLYSGSYEIEIQSSNPTNTSGSLRTTGEITTTDNQTKNVINVNNLIPSTSASFNTLNGFAFTSTITQTTGTIRGLFINPTLNASTDFKAIQSTSGGAYINTSTPNASAILQADSTTKGFLPPRMTTAQKNLIASPAAGLMVYDTDLNRPCFYSGSAWVTL